MTKKIKAKVKKPFVYSFSLRTQRIVKVDDIIELDERIFKGLEKSGHVKSCLIGKKKNERNSSSFKNR